MTTAHDGPMAVVQMTGRLDGESARHLSDTIEDLLRDGARNIELDMAGVSYVSSAATRVLAKRSEDLATLRGTLQVVSPSEATRSILAAAGLAPALIREGGPTRISRPTGGHTSWGLPAIEAKHGSYEISHYFDTGLDVRVIGTPESPLVGPADPARFERVPFPLHSFGLGLGAIADTADEAAPRMGELIAAEGVVGYLPTDGAQLPDFMVSYGDRAPVAMLSSGITWRGLFGDLVRFSARPSADEIPLAELAEVCLDMTGAEAIVLATVVETKGIVGASLRRPPAELPRREAGPFRGRELGNLLSFTPEPAHLGSTALILGVVARHTELPILPFLRPLTADGMLRGHLHAAVFPYTPVPQRTVKLPALVGRLFQTLPLRAVLHLVQDTRETGAAGTTGLLRGVCWMARINRVEGVA